MSTESTPITEDKHKPRTLGIASSALFSFLKWVWKLAFGTITWLGYTSQWCSQDVRRMQAERKGCYCKEWRHHVVYDTFEYDPNRPPQSKERMIGLREWVNA